MATTPSSTTTLSQSTSSTSTDLVELNTNTQLPIKLNANNYPAWHRQIHNLLVARNLDGYITGKTPCPPPIIKNVVDGSEIDNPAFNIWNRQDKYLYIALLGACDEEARAVMSAAPTARDAWLILERAFATRSRSRVMSLKERLNSRDELMNPHTPVTANYANQGRFKHHNRGRSNHHNRGRN
ncbi:unnamed protein product [Trifolium pratense]|uniref:Uncharacterized protein n=1 Tax=Trifolium pratense TaxID=57577 RepID=A0ACB0JE28_TRIPR|nr:unnamed protein product [Trifolium pratense]